MSTIVCYTRGTQSSAPDKTVGQEGKQLRMWIRQVDGHQVARIEADAGFDWTASVKPLLPGHPDWCPSTHFGYLESGEMRVRMQTAPSKRFAPAKPISYLPATFR